MNSVRFLKVHPGRILLEEFLAPRGVSVWHLARDIDVPARRIYEIVQGQRPITAEIAHRLAHYFGMSERYWLDLQARYDGKPELLSRESPRSQSLRYAGQSWNDTYQADPEILATTGQNKTIDDFFMGRRYSFNFL